jgi:hypothetical protein
MKGEVEFRNVDVQRLARGLPSLQGAGSSSSCSRIGGRIGMAAP